MLFFIKKFVDPIIIFSMILSMLDNKETGLWFEPNKFNLFLCTGITLATFSMDGKISMKKIV